jgi:diguanylate cyclase (GGDEF)-like protein
MAVRTQSLSALRPGKILDGIRERLTPPVVDAAILSVVVLGAFLAVLPLDLAHQLHEFGEKHADWQVDEFFLLCAMMMVAGIVYGARRLAETSVELRRREAAETRARTQALHDPLTGLANRRKLNEALALALSARKPAGASTGLILIDLDRFKPINDLHGHAVGDAVLKEVAHRLLAVTREGETVARLGGDEFALLLPQVIGAAEAARPARRILQALQEPILVGELVCRLSGSLGVAVTDNPLQADDLMRHADAALYVAKRQGRNQMHFFAPEMDADLQRRAQLELELREGLIRGDVTPAYQPLVDLETETVLGYEMLARWTRADGPVQPDVFIPIAEDVGLIGELTQVLLRSACQDARDWAPETSLSINVSPLQLRDPDFPDQLLAVLDAEGFAPERLEVEITESAIVTDLKAARDTLLKLKARGVRIALDDFGTGYSSLHHLRELPFDKLKIDRSFVMSMQTSEESRKIVDAIVAMSRSLGLITLAEGIENEADAVRLRSIGCQMGQGYHYGRPAPAGVHA